MQVVKKINLEKDKMINEAINEQRKKEEIANQEI